MKIQSHFSIRTRKSIRKKFQKHKTSHSFTISLHRKYCLMTGFLHVLPDFLILGTEKGGTTSLYRDLIQHPFINSPVTKEISFFSRYYDRGLNWYRVCFPFKHHKFFVKNLQKKNFLTGEASVRYFDHPHAPERIKQLIPNVKLIILLRNPIDRAYSQYNMIVRGGFEKLTFQQAIQKEKDRTSEEYEKMLMDKNYYSEIYFLYAYLNRGIYVDTLKKWMDTFPKEQFLIMHSKDFFDNSSKIYHKTLDFLNMPKFDLKNYYDIGISYKNPKMDSKLRSQLVEYFKPHNERLYKFLGRNFDWDK